MTVKARKRPLSPHFTIWKWGIHMIASVGHRVTGVGLSIVGAGLLVWWLAAAAGGADGYAAFQDLVTVDGGGLNIVGYVVLIGLSFVFFQHMMSGIRHLVLDVGAGYELRVNRLGAMLTFVGSTLLTALLWGYIIFGRG